MRLTCPNCAAAYEVPESVIPPEGRDVQCSNCGTAWFFQPELTKAFAKVISKPQEPEAAESDAPASASAPQTPEEAASAAAEEIARMAEPDPVAAEPEVAPEPEPAPAAEESGFADRLERRPLDTTVVDVLREEAAYEARARAGASGLEYQDDLPLSQPPKAFEAEPNTADAPFVEVDIDDEVPPAETVAISPAPTRRDRLPDIDELNSTLRDTTDREARNSRTAEAAAQLNRQRRGFRTGFGLACLVLAGFAALYTYAGSVAEHVPALEAPLRSYVDMVNDGRLWLEDAVGRLAERIEA